MTRKRSLFLLAFLVLSTASVSALTNTASTPEALAEVLAGDGVTITNVKFTGDSSQVALFENGAASGITID